MAFIDEINEYKNLVVQAAEMKVTIEEIAIALGIEIEFEVDTPNTLLEKIKNKILSEQV